jgi:nitrite reductase (NADH) small subunit/3-phenylpropionate/trans-cinnamate dioxygenase ferredoxin subunit
MAVQVGPERVALFNVAGTIFAIGDTCTHRGGPLSDGVLDGTLVTCPWHGAEFDVRTGQNVTPPAPQPVSCFKVRVQGDDIEIEVP